MEKVLLIGNDINNLSSAVSWNQVLNDICTFCNYNSIIDFRKTPFPLVYEQIFLHSRSNNYDGDTLNELELKNFIGKIVDNRKINKIHKAIAATGTRNIITTNYDYNLEVALAGMELSTENKGYIAETKYSVFRHTENSDTFVWHIHGESERPESINLGFEHYGGQLQHVRNYLTGTTDYSKRLPYRFDLKKIVPQSSSANISWVDLFFTSEVHILGLGLDFQEYDLWWLFSSRARMFDRAKKEPNPIVYHTPRKYFNKQKSDLMNSLKIRTVVHDLLGFEYYLKVLSEY